MSNDCRLCEASVCKKHGDTIYLKNKVIYCYFCNQRIMPINPGKKDTAKKKK